jgi:hypothetical protein
MTAHVRDLNEELLINILIYLEQQEIVGVVPRVCQAWHALVHGSIEYNKQCTDLFSDKRRQNEIVRTPALEKDYLTNWIWKEIFSYRYPESKRSRVREAKKKKQGNQVKIVTNGEPNWKMRYLERKINGKHCIVCNGGNILKDKHLFTPCACSTDIIHRYCTGSVRRNRQNFMYKTVNKCLRCRQPYTRDFKKNQPYQCIGVGFAVSSMIMFSFTMVLLVLLKNMDFNTALLTGAVTSVLGAAAITRYFYEDEKLKEFVDQPNALTSFLKK